MTKTEIIKLFVAVIIFAVVIAVVAVLGRIDTAQTIQLIITFVLVLVTVAYVKRTAEIASATREQAEATRQQADASMKMAEEMREQRYDTVRPVIDIVVQPMEGKELIYRGLLAENGKFPNSVPCKLRNIGVGPAIELFSCIEYIEGKPLRCDFGAIPVAIGEEEMGYTSETRLFLEQRGNHKALVAYYKDVYGRAFESSREVTLNKENTTCETGPLQIRLIKKDDLP